MRWKVESEQDRIYEDSVLAYDPILAAELVAQIYDHTGAYIVSSLSTPSCPIRVVVLNVSSFKGSVQ